MNEPEDKRIASLDILRGFVVLGIFIINVNYFSTLPIERYNPLAHGDFTGLNRWIWILSLTFVKQRFMAIFSILFGAGIYLMSLSNRNKGRSELGIHFSRMGWLLVLGMMHAYLIWDGDILVSYALCGSLVFFLRNAPVRLLWVLALALMVAPMVPGVMDLFQPGQVSEADLAFWNPDAGSLAAQLQANQGTYLEETPGRIARSFSRQTTDFVTFTLWRVGGLMLLGMVLVRNGFLTAQRSGKTYLRTLAVVGLVGAGISVAGTWQYMRGGFDYLFFARDLQIYFQIGSMSLGITYTAALMLLARPPGFDLLKRTLSALGRMAFTNYILQSIIGTLVFFGYGLGMYGQVDRTFLAMLTLAVWTFQILLSLWWLGRFRFGPLEWLWRSLTYRRLQPFRITPD